MSATSTGGGRGGGASASGGPAAGASSLKKFTHGQIEAKATSRAHDVPGYRRLLLEAAVRTLPDGVIVDTKHPQWAKLLQLCKAADADAKKKASSAAAEAATPATAVQTPPATPTATQTTTTAVTPPVVVPAVAATIPAAAPTQAVVITAAAAAAATHATNVTPIDRQVSDPLPTLAPTLAPTLVHSASAGATITPTAAAAPSASPTPSPASTPAPTLPVPAPVVVAKEPSSIERLLAKAASSVARATSKAAPAVPVESAARRSETPDPGAAASTVSSPAIVALSSSPQITPGAFLPPPAVAVSTTGLPAMPPRSLRSGSSSGVNPFISSLPPPQLPSQSITAPIAVPGRSISTTPNPGLSSSPAPSTPSASFFKNFLSKVSNEMNSITSSSSAASATSTSAASTSSTASTSSVSEPGSGPGAPPFAEPTFLPVSGPFPQPILSPMLAQSVAVTRTPPPSARTLRAGSKVHESAPAVPISFDEAVLPAEFLSAAPLKKKKSKRASEIVQIARAPAKLLPTPFQADRPASENPSVDEAAEEPEEEEPAPVHALSASPSGTRKVKKKKPKAKKFEEAAIATPSSSPPMLSSLATTSAVQPTALTPAAAAAAIVQPIPVLPSALPIVDDDIDMADLVDDDEDAHAADQAAPSVDALEGEGAEGEGDHAMEEGAAEGEDTNLPYALAALPHAIYDTLADLDADVLPAWRTHEQLSCFVPLLQSASVCHAILGAVRRERFGLLGCESANSGPHALLPEYSRVVRLPLQQFAAGKLRPKQLSDASFQFTLSNFMHEWMEACERVLSDAIGQPNFFAVSPQPSAATAEVIASFSQRTRALTNGLNELTPASPLLPVLQQLLLTFLQLRLQERLSAPASSWSPEDVIAFVQVYAPLLNKKHIASLSNAYQLNEVLERLHGLFEITPAVVVASKATAATLTFEQRFSSSIPEQITGGFALMQRANDVLLYCRHLPMLFAKLAMATDTATHFHQNTSVYLALEHSAQLYPDIAPWLIAQHLGIGASLYSGSVVDLLADRVGTLEHRCVDLSAAPAQLAFHASFLESSGPPPFAALDRVHQQYHYYLHYLRALLGIYEIVRRNDEIILEYMRVCMCFDRKSKTQLFRRQFEQQSLDQLSGAPAYVIAAARMSPPSADQLAWVPVRDSHAGSWAHEDAMLAILSQPAVYAFNRRTLGRLFAKFGFFKGMVALYLQELQATVLDASERLAMMQQCFLITLCCDDLPSFVNCVDACILSAATPLEQRVQLWKFILDQLHAMTVSPDTASIAPHHLTLRVLLQHLLHSIGSQLTVSLLLSDPRYIDLCDRANLPASFYSDVLEHAVLRCEQQALAHNMLESLDSYLWSDRSKNLTENFRAINDTEVSVGLLQKDQSSGHRSGASSPSLTDRRSLTAHPLAPFLSYAGDRVAEDDKPLASRRTSVSGSGSSNPMQRLQNYSVNFDYTAPSSGKGDTLGLPRYYEDMSNHAHWGVRVHLEEHRCAACTLPLVDPNAQRSASTNVTAGICVFRCHHLYHANCMQERACSLCPQSRWEEPTN